MNLSMQRYYDINCCMNQRIERIADFLEMKAEGFLHAREIRVQKRRKREAEKSAVREWAEALVWAVFWVLLINQFIFQLYQIPSSSMEDTLLIGDRVFVNKYIYGPEIYPSGPKVFSFRDPARNEVIVFENPAYVSRGPLFDIINRIIYMVTLSLVNIDKDEEGNPRAQLYVKRALGSPHDTIIIRNGSVSIRPAGFLEFLPEKEFRKQSDADFQSKRLISEKDYAVYYAEAQAQAYRTAGLDVPAQIVQDLQKRTSTSLVDYYEINRQYYSQLRKLQPENIQLQTEFMKYENGIYVPEGHMLPIGDNRDNSIDGRYFGPIPYSDVLGKAVFRFWPLSRIGLLR